MSERKEGTGQATSDEIEAALNKDHDVDNPNSVAFFKSLFKSPKIVIWKYGFKQLRDGWMIKLQFIENTKNKAGKKVLMGPTTMKGYFSDSVFAEFQKKILAIPLKERRDTSHTTSEVIINYPIPFPKAKTRIEPKTKLKDIWD